MVNLRRQFTLACKRILNCTTAPAEAFNAWLFRVLSESPADSHILFNPIPPSIKDPLESPLLKYVKANIARAIPVEDAILELERLLRANWNAARLTEETRDPISFDVDETLDTLKFSVHSGSGVPDQFLDYSLDRSYVDTLRERFEGSGRHSEFFESLWILLHRYTTLFGSKPSEGRGWQLAAPRQFMDVVRRFFCSAQTDEPSSGNFSAPKFLTECFASPFNAHPDNKFFSAFPDTDGPFGSYGNFFHSTADLPDVLELNPPFEPAVMLAAVDRIESVFSSQPNSRRIAVFVVPNWSECLPIDRLKQSKLLKTQFILQKSKHRYVNGFQHRMEKESHRMVYGESDTLIAVLGTGFEIDFEDFEYEVRRAWLPDC